MFYKDFDLFWYQNAKTDFAKILKVIWYHFWVKSC